MNQPKPSNYLWIKQAVMRAPFLAVTLPFVVGIVLGREYQEPWMIFTCMAAMLAVVGLLLRGYMVIVLLGFCALGLWRAENATLRKTLPSERSYFISQLSTTPSVYGRYQRSTAKVLYYKDSLTGEWVDAKGAECFVNIDTNHRVHLGETILYRSKLYSYDEPYSSYYLNQGIQGRQYVYQLDRGELDSNAFALERLRTELSDRLRGISNEDSSAVATIEALTLGMRDNLDRATREAYRAGGVSHLLAISGLHVGIVFAILNVFLWAFRLFGAWGRAFNFIVVLSVLWGYALLSGMSASVVRAVVMFSLMQVGLLFYGARLLNTLLIAAFGMLMWNPNYLFDVGFQLSYVAMLGIILMFIPLMGYVGRRWRMNKLCRTLLGVVLVSLSAQIFTAPLVLYTFGEISLVGLLSNIAVWITVPIVIFGGFLYLLLPLEPIGWSVVRVAAMQNDIIASIGGLENSTLSVDDFPLWALWLIYGVIACVLLYLSRAKQRAMLDS